MELFYYLAGNLILTIMGAGSYKIYIRVRNAAGEGLLGVSIIEKGYQNGTISDIDGNAVLSVHSLSSTLVFSFIGYKTQEKKLNGKMTVDIVMEEDIAPMEQTSC